MPAQGGVQGRFGAERPDGGTWRGIIIRASEGSPVQAIAPGKVVFADWLSGFGNLLIIDHGQRSEEHTSELQSRGHLVCRLLLEKKKKKKENMRSKIRDH